MAAIYVYIQDDMPQIGYFLTPQGRFGLVRDQLPASLYDHLEDKLTEVFQGFKCTSKSLDLMGQTIREEVVTLINSGRLSKGFGRWWMGDECGGYPPPGTLADLGKKLRWLRVNAFIGLHEMADSLGESIVAVADFEAGNRSVSIGGLGLYLDKVNEAMRKANTPKAEAEEVVTLDKTVGLLGLVLESPPPLDSLTQAELESVFEWAGKMHLEASDCDVEAGPAPMCLRRLLPMHHYLHNWRVMDHDTEVRAFADLIEQMVARKMPADIARGIHGFINRVAEILDKYGEKHWSQGDHVDLDQGVCRIAEEVGELSKAVRKENYSGFDSVLWEAMDVGATALLAYAAAWGLATRDPEQKPEPDPSARATGKGVSISVVEGNADSIALRLEPIDDEDEEVTATSRSEERTLSIERDELVDEEEAAAEEDEENEEEDKDPYRWVPRSGVWYVAHPYGSDPHNLDRVRCWLRWLHSRGCTAIAPWVIDCELYDDSVEDEREAGLARNLDVIEKCSGVLLLGREVSVGMATERRHAQNLCIPVVDATHLGLYPPEDQ